MSNALVRLQASLERIVLDPKYHDLLAILKGARNGAVYGTKVRFPHALVMVLLFRSGTLGEKAGLIFRATKTHAQNLAKFAVIYKSTCLMLKRFGATPGKEGPYDTLLSGLIAGYLVFGARSRRSGKISSINQQIVIYVFARVVLALARLSIREGSPLALIPALAREPMSSRVRDHAWPVFASVSWGLVMWLFRWYPEELQPSLRASMGYIYQQSDEWDSLRSLVWHNR